MATIFQTPEWEKFKLSTGYEKSWRVFEILVLKRKIPLLGSMLYSPMATHDQTKLATQKIFTLQIKKIAKEEKAIFFRLESDDEIGEIKPDAAGYQKSFEEMQPEHTLILDISKSEEEILAQMKPKGRYNIRVAEKHGVKVAPGKVEDFFPLYVAMAKRQKISHRNLSYFQNLIDILGAKGYAKVFIAKISKSEIRNPKQTKTNSNVQNSKVLNLKNTNLEFVSPVLRSSAATEDGNFDIRDSDFPALAGAIVVFYGDRATYLFGGSSEEMRNVMAPYKLHWEIMREAKKRGCKIYDLFGIAPNDDEKHPWAGVSRFKRAFGGEEFTALGSWDLIFSPIKYRLFKIGEKLRR